MGNYQTNRYNSTQVITNEFLNSSNQQCISWSQSAVTDSTIIVTNSRVTEIEIVASGEADVGCTINQQMNTTVTSQLVAQSVQDNSVDSGIFQFYNNVTRTTANQTQSLYNNVTNITNSTCGDVSSQTVDNGLIIANEVRGRRIGISANSQSSGSCTLTNMIAVEAYNQGVTTSDQQNTIEAGLGGFLIAIIALIILIVVIVIIAGVAKKMFAPKPPQPVQPPPGSLEAELATL